MAEYYYVVDEDDYRNADARDHRANPGAPAGATFIRPGTFVRPAPGPVPIRTPTFVQPTPVLQPAPVAPTYAAPPAAQPYMPLNYYQPPGYPPGYPMQGYQGPGYPAPGYPGPWGQPPGYCGFGGGWGGGPAMQSLGRVLSIATPIVVSLLPLPVPPTPVQATGDCATDLKGALANEANQITYQTSLAKAAKRDELWYALGGGLGKLLEKGLRP